MSHSLNSLKGAIQGIIEGRALRVIEGDTKRIDYSSYHPCITLVQSPYSPYNPCITAVILM